MPAISVGTTTFLHKYSEFSVAEIFIPSGTVALRGHTHRHAQLHLVLEGSYAESCRERECILAPGSALFRPAGELHFNRFLKSEVHGLLIEVEAEALSGLLPGVDVSRPEYFPAHAFCDLCRLYEQEARDDE